MLYIPYNPQSDPWYQFGNAVANGLGLLADNRMARGEAKNFNSELANDQANKMQGLFNQVQSMGNIDAKDDTGWNEANAKLGAMGYSGPKLTRDNREQIQNGLLNQQQYWGNFDRFNEGKRFHDSDYQDYNKYRLGMPGLLG
ncbi:MAG: hypothetical protein HXP18_01120 [Veillonella sp.]|jgi:hypothetical protein|nr:hypothetical protein [Veillonella sp.]DAP50672.1 MAG TPA: hypothetical protein [Caudoviricetes sp.]DAU41894.1 MAG TPA: hypothetical protein [Caudoviricetes sp.]